MPINVKKYRITIKNCNTDCVSLEQFMKNTIISDAYEHMSKLPWIIAMKLTAICKYKLQKLKTHLSSRAIRKIEYHLVTSENYFNNYDTLKYFMNHKLVPKDLLKRV